MLALDARTGAPIPTFGKAGVVDLKLENDQELDLAVRPVLLLERDGVLLARYLRG